MNARAARQIHIGDRVVVAFGTSHRLSRVVEINWPHFHVRTHLENGQERIQRSRYQALTLPADCRPGSFKR